MFEDKNSELIRDLKRLTNDRDIPHRSRTTAQSAISYIRKLEENSFTFDEFVAAAKRDNKLNVGKGRKFIDWMAAIKEQLTQGH